MGIYQRLVGYLFSMSAVLGVSAGVMAADDPMICAVTQAMVCTKGEECTQGTASDINMPLFLKINPGENEILSLKEDGQRRVSKIKNSAKDVDNRFVIYQGVEQGGAWSVVVDASSGAMTVSVAAGENEAYVVYGACSQSLLKP